MFNYLNLLGAVDPATILMGVNIFMLSFIVFGFLMGLKRGVRSSLLRFIFLMGIILTLVVTAPLISRALLNMDISSIIGSNTIDVGGETYAVTSGSDLIVAVISGQEEIATIIGENPVLLEFIQQIPMVIMNLFIFVVGFFVLKILSWPFYAIIARKMEKKRIKKTKELNANKNIKKDKKRLLGGLVGVFSGGLVALVIFVPIAGISSILNSYPEDNEWFDSIIPEEISQYLSIYEDSIIGRFGSFTNLDLLLFDSLTTIRVNQLDGEGNPTGETYKFNFRKEIVEFSNIIDEAYHIVEMIKARYDGTSDTIDWDYIENTIDRIFRLETARIILTEIFPTLSAELIDENLIVTDPAEIALLSPLEKDMNNFYISLKNRLSLSNTQSVKTDVDAVIGVLRALDEYGFVDIALDEYHSEGEDIDKLPLLIVEKIKDNPSFAFTVMNNIVGSDSFKMVTVAGTNVIIGFAEEFINENNNEISFSPIPRITHTEINWAVESALYASIINNIADFSYDILYAQSQDLEGLEMVSSADFRKLGETINMFRQTILLGEVYIDLLENLITINDIQDAISDIDEHFNILGIINLIDTADWEFEFGFINDIIEIAIDYEEESLDYTKINDLISSLKNSDVVQYVFDGAKSYLFIEILEKTEIPSWADNAGIDMISNNSELFTKIIEIAMFMNEEKEPGVNNEITDITYEQINELVLLFEDLIGSTSPEHIQLVDFMNGVIQLAGDELLDGSVLLENLYFEDLIENMGALVELYFVYQEIGGDAFAGYDAARMATLQNRIIGLNDMSPDFKLFLGDIVEEFFGSDISVDFNTIDWVVEADMINDLIEIVKDYHLNGENLDTLLMEQFLIDFAEESSLLDIFFQMTLNELTEDAPAYEIVDPEFIVEYAEYISLRIDLELYHAREDADPSIVVAKANNIILMLNDARDLLVDEEIYGGADHTEAIAFIDEAIAHANEIINEYVI